MRKLILAIIAIICLDVVYAYMSADRSKYITYLESKEANLPGDDIYGPANQRNNLTTSTQTAGNMAETNTRLTLTGVPADNPDTTNTNHHHLNKISRSSPERRSYTAKLRPRSINNEQILPARIDSLYEPVIYVVPKPYIAGIEKEVAVKEPIDRKSDVSQPVSKNSPKPENRSLIARALPIVKKPYDWIKALGSRLN